jgi:cytidylate kinase
LPNADLKIYLTATVEVRAKRRLNQLKEKNVDITFEEVMKDVISRDSQDSEREHAPLAVASDAYVIDTTNDTLDDTVNRVIQELKKRNLLS